MTRPTLEIVSEDAGLYAIARDAGETLGVIGPMDDRDAIMAAAVERWPDVEHVDLPDALPGLWRERGGLSGLVRLDAPATTPGMVMVAKASEPWRTRPELRWQVWPDDLEPDDPAPTNMRGDGEPLTGYDDIDYPADLAHPGNDPTIITDGPPVDELPTWTTRR
ncbi:hypothetical protein U4674_004756 [Salmonella enterica]|nr:hypothetical protein [Salmonella enterica]ELJ3229229.1 hypothetical protein [Salmonella enterica]ELR4477757.1 hypothetical protein [Salmonella enterica]EMA7640525.1 hypothetical protein [Salmonella enterica]EMD0418000.1 hypothetical protein [Salmonella enterica]